VLALAQHSTIWPRLLMSAFHGGTLRTMRANYLNDAGDVRVNPPLVYARERQTADFAQSAGLAGDPRQLPGRAFASRPALAYEATAGRPGAGNKYLFKSLLSTMRPLLGPDRCSCRNERRGVKLTRRCRGAISLMRARLIKLLLRLFAALPLPVAHAFVLVLGYALIVFPNSLRRITAINSPSATRARHPRPHAPGTAQSDGDRQNHHGDGCDVVLAGVPAVR